MSEANPAQSSVQEGDDVVVVFPSGRQVTGRVEELVIWGGALCNFIVWVEEYAAPRIYPPGWVHAWEDAPEEALRS